MSSSEMNHFTPITSLEYRNIDLFGPGAAASAALDGSGEEHVLQMTERELSERMARAGQQATVELEMRLRREYEAQLARERAALAEALAGFDQERNEYYSRVESEVVQLALAVAGKILHREAQVDRMLLAALVRVAIENLQHRSNITVRVRPEKCGPWRTYFAQHLKGLKVEVLEDSQLDEHGCILETELGSADVSLDAQIKEIERGFFDLLAQRPENR